MRLMTAIPWSISFLAITSFRQCMSRVAFESCFVKTNIKSKRSAVALSRMSSKNNDDDVQPSREKRIILIRHGCTYMNEYIHELGDNWPNFCDDFPSDQRSQYWDTPLAPTGIEQAKELGVNIGKLLAGDQENCKLSLAEEDKSFIDDLELLVISPLTRALETAQYALLPHLKGPSDDLRIMAYPKAAERFYFVSDVGKTPSDLAKSFDWVDFESGFLHLENKNDPWWFHETWESIGDGYVEWRPTGSGQQYMFPGEPQSHFDRRMVELCQWLDDREEKTIALVCHWGVINWFTNENFHNCELRVLPFEQLRSKASKFSAELLSQSSQQ